MKRFNYLLFLLVGVLVMVSCGKSKKNEPDCCWKVSATTALGQQSETIYYWGSQEDAKKNHPMHALVATGGVTITAEKADAADEDACEELNK